MTKRYDVIVIGTGAMGSATVYHLTQKNKKVLGIDRFSPPHSLGSSHGHTRIIREAYQEGPQYVPIVQLAYANWDKLQKDYGQQIYLQTGGLVMGTPDNAGVKGAKLSADLHQLPYKIFAANEIRKQFPAFRIPDDTIAVWEPRAGILYPEKCIDAHITLARKHHADFIFNEPAVSWDVTDDGVCVTTSKGKYYAEQLLLTTGAWLNDFLPGLNVPLTVERQVLYWFDDIKKSDSFRPDKFPIFIWSPAPGEEFYGFPDTGDGIKIARHHSGEITDPDTVNRQVKEEEIEVIRTFLRKYIPDANGQLRSTEVCLYTNTPDNHFRIFRHPQYSPILAASICSGHGFKFSSAMGDILAELLIHNKPSFDLTLFEQSF